MNFQAMLTASERVSWIENSRYFPDENLFRWIETYRAPSMPNPLTVPIRGCQTNLSWWVDEEGEGGPHTLLYYVTPVPEPYPGPTNPGESWQWPRHQLIGQVDWRLHSLTHTGDPEVCILHTTIATKLVRFTADAAHELAALPYATGRTYYLVDSLLSLGCFTEEGQLTRVYRVGDMTTFADSIELPGDVVSYYRGFIWAQHTEEPWLLSVLNLRDPTLNWTTHSVEQEQGSAPVPWSYIAMPNGEGVSVYVTRFWDIDSIVGLEHRRVNVTASGGPAGAETLIQIQRGFDPQRERVGARFSAVPLHAVGGHAAHWSDSWYDRPLPT